jgi:HAD superfamily hydrolase (TIGR01549 family)
MIRGVLFDLDGTLVDTWELYVEAYTRTLEPVYGHRLTLDELIKLGPTSELRFFRRALRADITAWTHREFLRHYRSLHGSHFGGVYPGAHEMLRSIRRLGCRLGIVTGKSRGAWEITAKEAGLGEFDAVITDEDVAEAKPDPEGLALALAKLGIQADEAVYVGDSVGDAKAARAACLRFAAALWPKAKNEIDEFLARVQDVGYWVGLSSPERLVACVEESRA